MIWLGCALSSCTVLVKDIEVCADNGSGANCFHTLSEDSRDLNAADWAKERIGELCVSPDAFANWKEAILKLCDSQNCTFEMKQKLAAFADRVAAHQPKHLK